MGVSRCSVGEFVADAVELCEATGLNVSLCDTAWDDESDNEFDVDAVPLGER